jgi:S1-C subfamily serine protease
VVTYIDPTRIDDAEEDLQDAKDNIHLPDIHKFFANRVDSATSRIAVERAGCEIELDLSTIPALGLNSLCVVTSETASGQPAAGGLSAGCVIVGVDQKVVASLDELEDAINEVKNMGKT